MGPNLLSQKFSFTFCCLMEILSKFSVIFNVNSLLIKSFKDVHAKLTLMFKLFFLDGLVLFFTQVTPLIFRTVGYFVSVDVGFDITESWSVASNWREIRILLIILKLQVITRNALELPCVISIWSDFKYP